jgi:hypothetical protein
MRPWASFRQILCNTRECDKFVVEYKSVKEDDMMHSFHMGAKDVRM